MYNMNKKKMKNIKTVNPINRSAMKPAMDDSSSIGASPIEPSLLLKEQMKSIKSGKTLKPKPTKKGRPPMPLEQSVDKGIKRGLKNFRVR